TPPRAHPSRELDLDRRTGGASDMWSTDQKRPQTGPSAAATGDPPSDDDLDTAADGGLRPQRGTSWPIGTVGAFAHHSFKLVLVGDVEQHRGIDADLMRWHRQPGTGQLQLLEQLATL